jgi:hypothetical protein
MGIIRDDRIASILLKDEARVRVLSIVQAQNLSDCWIGAGMVRSAVWDALAGRPPAPVTEDVDVIWFDPSRDSPDVDKRIEQKLVRLDASVRWSVKNQSRMHLRNEDPPYRSCEDALRHWPETATAVAVRLDETGGLEILAPCGLADLFAGIVRPTARFARDKQDVFEARWRGKRWLERWTFLRVISTSSRPED